MNYIILGLIQGLTEFLPISSSAHLVIFQNLLGVEIPGLTFEVFVHFCTTLSVIYLFKEEIANIISSFLISISKLNQWDSFLNFVKKDYSSKFAWLLLISTIPGAIAGYLFQNTIEKIFNNLLSIGVMLTITGLCLSLIDRYSGQIVKRTIREVTWLDSVLIGIGQAIAIFPGISRSGLTIMTGLSRGLERKLAAKYSFILSIPIILGASLYKIKDFSQLNIDIFTLIFSGLAAFLSGCFAIKIFIKMLLNFKLRYFSFYLWLLAIIIIFLNMGN